MVAAGRRNPDVHKPARRAPLDADGMDGPARGDLKLKINALHYVLAGIEMPIEGISAELREVPRCILERQPHKRDVLAVAAHE